MKEFLGNVAGKALKGAAHAIIGAGSFGLGAVAGLWTPPTGDPIVTALWGMFGAGALATVSVALGRAVNYDPRRDPRHPLYQPPGS